MTTEPIEDLQACPACGARFACGMAQGQPSCWCMEKPIGVALPDSGGKCYCPACLERLSAEASFPASSGSHRG